MKHRACRRKHKYAFVREDESFHEHEQWWDYQGIWSYLLAEVCKKCGKWRFTYGIREECSPNYVYAAKDLGNFSVEEVDELIRKARTA